MRQEFNIRLYSPFRAFFFIIGVMVVITGAGFYTERSSLDLLFLLTGFVVIFIFWRKVSSYNSVIVLDEEGIKINKRFHSWSIFEWYLFQNSPLLQSLSIGRKGKLPVKIYSKVDGKEGDEFQEFGDKFLEYLKRFAPQAGDYMLKPVYKVLALFVTFLCAAVPVIIFSLGIEIKEIVGPLLLFYVVSFTFLIRFFSRTGDKAS